MEPAATTTLAITSFAGNSAIALSPPQQFLMAHVGVLTDGWWFLWSAVALFVLLHMYHEIAQKLRKGRA